MYLLQILYGIYTPADVNVKQPPCEMFAVDASIQGVGGGTKNWIPGPNTFPDGLAAFHAETGWNITAHNRMWSADTVYAKQNGGKFAWIIEGAEAVRFGGLVRKT